jgi:hypothetical protein
VSRPVFVIAQVWSLPADTAATWPRVEGTVDCPELPPAQTSSPSDALMPQMWFIPAEMAVAFPEFNDAGGVGALVPQHWTLPRVVSAQAHVAPTAISEADSRLGIAEVNVLVAPQQRTELSSRIAHALMEAVEVPGADVASRFTFVSVEGTALMVAFEPQQVAAP